MSNRRTGPAPIHTDEQYLSFDVGSGDDFPSEVECRKTALVITKKDHPCFGTGTENHGHIIPAGTRVCRETGKCEGRFGTVYMCLPCLDIWLEPDWW